MKVTEVIIFHFVLLWQQIRSTELTNAITGILYLIITDFQLSIVVSKHIHRQRRYETTESTAHPPLEILLLLRSFKQCSCFSKTNSKVLWKD